MISLPQSRPIECCTHFYAVHLPEPREPLARFPERRGKLALDELLGRSFSEKMAWAERAGLFPPDGGNLEPDEELPGEL